jgi:hypothetical protein
MAEGGLDGNRIKHGMGVIYYPFYQMRITMSSGKCKV